MNLDASSVSASDNRCASLPSTYDQPLDFGMVSRRRSFGPYGIGANSEVGASKREHPPAIQLHSGGFECMQGSALDAALARLGLRERLY